MIQGKQLTVAIAVCAVFFSGNVLAFDKDFDPNHKIIDRESIGPNFKSDLIIDKEKAAKEKTAEEGMRLPSGVNPQNPSGSNPNNRIGSDRK
ncbi:MAG TPA: hypothetical protein VK141_07530 [Nitrosomonas sp.]|nr:hypothetical protein [Nitrosomonas sp.]